MDIHYRLINKQLSYDQIIKSEVLLQHHNDLQASKLIQISIFRYDTVAVEYYNNPMLKSILYYVDSPDVTIVDYATHVISENMLTQVDED